MPAYVIADVRDAWDADALQEYRRRNTDSVAAAGGRFLVRGGEHELLEGEWDTRRIVVMEFPDLRGRARVVDLRASTRRSSRSAAAPRPRTSSWSTARL